MPKPVERTGPRLAYRPGLDGLRAIAVAGVFLYHSRIDWLPGGFLGVDLFFVLSGYLITSILLVEWEARNRIDLRRFWLRRARRLLPALVVVVLAALILAAIFARDDLARTRGDAVSSLLYYTNWHEIIANHSYFNLMGRPSLLQHLWSLAVEEQFYLIWPLLLVPGLVLLGRKRLPFLVAAGIAGSAALMWLLYNPTDPTRVWNGTDTRAFLLLMGILLALVWPYVERLRRALPLLELFGVAALVATVLLFRQMHDYDPTLWQGGDLAERHPQLALIVDHVGMNNAIPIAQSATDTIALAKYPNVTTKMKGGAQYAPEPYPYPNMSTQFKRVFEAYGPQRCHWETDITQTLNGVSCAGPEPQAVLSKNPMPFWAAR